jgi:peptidyl-dipeptidase Dcp
MFMRAFFISVLTLIAFMANAENPLFTEYNTVHGTIPFSSIKNSHWEEAIDRGINKAQQEVDAITKQQATPTFENTIVALENTGKDLDRVLNAFYPLLESNCDDEMMEISVRASQKLSDYSTSITLNEKLWQRVKQVYQNRNSFKLDTEDKMLLDKTYDSFALSGADLEGQDRETYKALKSELSALTTTYSQNVLRELNASEFWLTANDLDSLPESSITTAAEAAAAKGRKGEYLFTFDFPCYSAFMKYSARRDLREKMYKMYSSRNTKGEYSNIEILSRIAEIRRQIANLLGSPNYATQSLKRTMAETPEHVYDLLNRLRDAYLPAQKAEMAELTKFASDMEGKAITIQPWDYSYYSNKLKAAKYSFDEEELRPYFELDNVINGVFGLATKLYGLQFTQNNDIEVYHPDVKAFDVTDENGKFVGVIYTDFFPRASKSPGAWMTSFKDQYIDADGNDSRPQVTIVMNFTKPTADKPSLLTPSEVETFLHEFGHALHGLLADTKYKSLSGTSVYRDFVELPSQFNENYLTEKEFLDGFARHYQTGEAIPEELVQRLIKSSQYGAAYSCIRQLTFGYLDMAWHTITEPVTDPVAFEQNAIKDISVFAPVEGTMISQTFSHIFAGGYAAGYYSYKWAEVLDADAFAHFKESGIFDRATADSFRKNVLTKGGTVNPAELYRSFRGQDPSIDALLIRDGIKSAPKVEIKGAKKN